MSVDRTHYYIDAPCPDCGGRQYTDGRARYCELCGQAAPCVTAADAAAARTFATVDALCADLQRRDHRLQRAAQDCETPECQRPATHVLTHALPGGLCFTYHCRKHAGPDAERFAWRLLREWLWYWRQE